MNRTAFFNAVRSSLFGGKLTVPQVAGMDAILNKWEGEQLIDDRWLAYMLATAFHETATTMQPVMETRQPKEAINPSVDQAISRLESSWKRGKLTWVKTPYWRKDAQGKSWLGRGLVQLTHKANYLRLSQVLGIDLVSNPDVAMETEVAVKIMVEGMTRGLFTSKKLSDYFGSTTDWKNARRIINGIESADKVAAVAQKFHAATKAAK